MSRVSLYTLKQMYSLLDISVKAYIMNIVNRSSKTCDLALLFAALSDRTRLRLLNLMDGREVCVCYFVEILGQSQPKISRHLAYLRTGGRGSRAPRRQMDALQNRCAFA